jgi:hypothetical protein
VARTSLDSLALLAPPPGQDGPEAGSGLANAAAVPARPIAADVGHVDLDVSRESEEGVVRQGGAYLVQQHPGRLVAAQARIALELEGRDPLLVAGHEEDREEPRAHGHLRAMKGGAGRERGLVAADCALPQATGA